jgi:metaxin
LYSLYLDPANFASVARPRYIDHVSNGLVRTIMSHQLQSAAREELTRISSSSDPDFLHEQADRAIEALSRLLGDKTWFFGDSPTLFDASVFAYTYLLATEDWKDDRLSRSVGRRRNLIRHRDLLVEQYYAAC